MALPFESRLRNAARQGDRAVRELQGLPPDRRVAYHPQAVSWELEEPSACVQMRSSAICGRSGGDPAIRDLAVEAIHPTRADTAHGSHIGQQVRDVAVAESLAQMGEW